MANLGVCHESIVDGTTLMRAGLAVVVVGHVNFLLGALVHGTVLRHISLRGQSHAAEYTVAHVAALVAGLVGIIAGVSTIIVSKQKSKMLMWYLLWISLLDGLLAAGSAAGLTVTLGRAIALGPQSLLAHCKVQNASSYPAIANECPFNPTRIYGTTIVIWVPLIVLCLVQSAFLGRNIVSCVSYLHFPSPIWAKRTINATQVRELRPQELTLASWEESRKQGDGLQQDWTKPSELKAEAQKHKLQGWHSRFNRSSLWI